MLTHFSWYGYNFQALKELDQSSLFMLFYALISL